MRRRNRRRRQLAVALLLFSTVVYGQKWQIFVSSGGDRPMYSVDYLETITWDMAGRKSLVVRIKGDITFIPVDSIDVIQFRPFQGFHLLGGTIGFFIAANMAPHQMQYILESIGPSASPSPFMWRVGLLLLSHISIGSGVGSLMNIVNGYFASERYDISGGTVDAKVQVIQEIITSKKNKWLTRKRRSLPIISTSPGW